MSTSEHADNVELLQVGDYVRFRFGRRIWVVQEWVHVGPLDGDDHVLLVRTYTRRGGGSFQYKALNRAERASLRIVPSTESDDFR